MKKTADETSQEERTINLYPLPGGWKWITVGDAGANQKNAIVDGPFGSNLKVSDYVEGGPVPVLTTKNLEGNYENVRYISNEKFEELRRSAVYPGDILMAKIGSCGKTGIYPPNKPPAMIPANLLKVTLNNQFELKYVYHYFNSTFFQKALRTITKATAQPAFGVTNFRKLPLPYTTRDRQKNIVAEIEKQFSRLDEAVANLKRVKANLKRYKAAVLKAAVEGRLVETEAEFARREGRSYETGAQLLQRILETRRSQWKGKGKYKEPAAPDTTDLPQLPEGWVWCGFEQVSVSNKHALKAGPFGSALKKEMYVESGFKIYGQEQVINGDSTFGDYFIDASKYRELESCAVKPGDLLISLVGTAGKVLVLPPTAMPGIINPRLLKLSLNLMFIAPAYAAYLLQSAWAKHYFKLQAHGGTMEILNLGIIKALPVPLPPLDEQNRIVAEVDRRLSLQRVAEAQIDANIQRAERLRHTVLSGAFSGELVKGLLEPALA